MNRIAPYLVNQLRTHPDGVQECCRFLSVSQYDFINLTLKYTLPQLFAESDLKGLDAVAREMNSSVALLFLDQAHYILAHAFMLQGPGQTNKTLQFILNLLKAAATDASSLQISTLVGSCIVLLLTEIVICLGDEDPDVVDTVRAHIEIEGIYSLYHKRRPKASGKWLGNTHRRSLDSLAGPMKNLPRC